MALRRYAQSRGMQLQIAHDINTPVLVRRLPSEVRTRGESTSSWPTIDCEMPVGHMFNLCRKALEFEAVLMELLNVTEFK
jgi:hypothetical protein